MAKSVTFQEFIKFYSDRLQPRSYFRSPKSDNTLEFKNVEIGIDSRTNDIWRITLDLKDPKKEIEVDTGAKFEGTILELLEQKLDERLMSRRSGAL